MVGKMIRNDIDLDGSLEEIGYKYDSFKAKILVFGVGGGGVNAINSMIDSDDLDDVEFAVANTDSQSLSSSKAKIRILLGSQSTHGLGAGSDPAVGKSAAEESIDEIEHVLSGVNMVFLTAGMGGGTGTGAIPVIAKKAKEMGILVAAVVTKPFTSEGANRMDTANDGIKELKKYVDTLIIIPNQNLLRIANQNTKLKESFKMVDDVLKYGVKGVTDLITKPGYINRDFADVKTVMSKAGRAMMGTGEASGVDKAQKAVDEAMSNPLLDNVSIKGAKGIIINITGSPDMTLFEYDNASKRIKEEVDNEYANMIIGSVFDETLEDTMRVSIFATGIGDDEEEAKQDIGAEEEVERSAGEDVTDEDDIYKNIERNNNAIKAKYFIDTENNKQQPVGFTKRIYTRRKIADDEYENKDVVDDFFDMGESATYDSFTKSNTSQKNAQKRSDIEERVDEEDFNINADTGLNGRVSKTRSDDVENNTKRRDERTNVKTDKKQGFFSSLFGNRSSNKENNDDFDDEDIDVNIEYYSDTPSYLRKKNK